MLFQRIGINLWEHLPNDMLVPVGPDSMLAICIIGVAPKATAIVLKGK